VKRFHIETIAAQYAALYRSMYVPLNIACGEKACGG
jgi:hypothetical protein